MISVSLCIVGTSIVVCKIGLSNTSLLSLLNKSDCPRLDSFPGNARVRGNGSTFGSCAEFSCESGHTLFGERKICCSENGTWNSTKATCFRGNVGVLDALPFSFQNYFLQSFIFRRCCRYSSSFPDCPISSPTNGRVQGSDSTFGSCVQFSCNDGHTLFGCLSLFLSSFSKELFSRSTFHECWSSSFFPDCSIVDSSLTNGRVQGTDSTFGSCVQFSCNDGHTLFGERTICCSDNGTWNATKPTCVKGVLPYFRVIFSKELFGRSTFHECWSSSFFPDCPIFDSSPTNGRVQGSDSTFGSCVQFSCYDGHTLFGERTICCSDNGTWNATKPTCFKGTKSVTRWSPLLLSSLVQ